MPNSSKAFEYASILTEALPYIRRYQGKTIVIKYGGNAMTDPELKQSFARDMVSLKSIGINPVIVHGGGPQINNLLERVGIKSEFFEGLRVTDSETMNIVEMVLGGSINKEIVDLINREGGQAVGLSGKDGHLIKAKKLAQTVVGGPDYGHVGEIESIDPHLLNVLDSNHFIPVIAPIGADSQGNTFNINADSVAGEIAIHLKAERLLLLTNTVGVLDKSGQLIKELNQAQTDALIEDKTISGGMLPKIECARHAVNEGVKGAAIIDGRQKHAALLEIFSNTGFGTLFT